MRTIHLIWVEVEAAGSVTVKLEDGYRNCLVFYPAGLDYGGYLNIFFLEAKRIGKSIQCLNTDGVYSHEFCILQFDSTLPPIFKIEPWQLL